MPSSSRARGLPEKYIIESCGPFVLRYVEFPDGRRIQLLTRKAVSCGCQSQQQLSIIPDQSFDEEDRRIFA